MMRFSLLRYAGVLWCCLCLLPALGAPKQHAATDWSVREISVPVAPLTAPLPWVKPPSGPGEFLLSWNSYFSVPVTIGRHDLLATQAGVLCREPDGELRLLAAGYGQAVMIVGQYEGRMWIQQEDGDLIGLNPETLLEQERLPKLAGPCFALDAHSVWCYDSGEMGHDGLLVMVGNRNPFASALIEYSRAGKELHRFTADGKSLPKTEIASAYADADAVWVVSRPCLAIICSCGAKHYGEMELLRIDRATGKVEHIPHTENINPVLLNQPNRLIWSSPGEMRSAEDHGSATLYVLDKATCAVTPRGKIPASYAAQILAAREEQLWCAETIQRQHRPHTPFDIQASRTGLVVFSLTDGKRIHRDTAGQPPAEIPAIAPQPPLAGYTLCGGSTGRAWLQGQTQQIYEIPDNETILVHDCSALGNIAGEHWWGTPPPDSVYVRVGSFDEEGSYLVKLLPGMQKAMKLSSSSQEHFFSLTASERRIWVDAGLITTAIDANGPIHAFTGPSDAERIDFGYSGMVPLGDVLYSYQNSQLVRADVATQRITAVASWRAQAPKEWQHIEHGDALFSTPDGKLVLQLTKNRRNTEGVVEEKPTSLLAVYTPATDAWTFSTTDRQLQFFNVLQSLSGTYATPSRERMIYRGTAAGWTPVGKLPCSVELRSSVATPKYLYTGTSLGILRIPWQELSKEAAR